MIAPAAAGCNAMLGSAIVSPERARVLEPNGLRSTYFRPPDGPESVDLARSSDIDSNRAWLDAEAQAAARPSQPDRPYPNAITGSPNSARLSQRDGREREPTAAGIREPLRDVADAERNQANVTASKKCRLAQ